ncbi:HAMP domain-containing sensor histidine kinase [Clostridium sp.]|uniref:HAMP domain-containing sensor histidine kinase n=1 Tax=Clostridium sp. TaxID=1506 RepID=UPI00260C91AE|nr:HAMP domain-containing sensor histidine kinase [Clostridium sp.]
MLSNKTIKSDFYLLVIKIFSYTFISTIVAYALLVIFLFISTNYMKTADYYEKYLNEIEDEIIRNIDSVLQGRLIDLNSYSDKIKGEVVDINGNHLFGDADIVNKNIDVLKSMEINTVRDNYVYRCIPLVQDNCIRYIYVLRAPFGYITNNIHERPDIVAIYITLIASPIIFFIMYLFLFTKKLYKSISKNIQILLNAAGEISEGNYLFEIKGLQGMEFKTIQDSFNKMINALKETIEGLSKLENERKMITSSIAHDIRTPITVINGELELISELRDEENFSMDDYIETIKRNCDKMVKLTDNLSLIYKVDNLNFLFRIQKVDLNKLLIEKKRELLSLANKKNIEFQFYVNLSKKYYMLDESMLNRVLDNILHNSLRFTNSGRIKLIVSDENTEGKIYFKCIDTGTGFKEKDTHKLFSAFYQSESYKNHFGLGLYIAKKIVQNYQGEISAYNNEYNGATIEFFIVELMD